MTGPMKSLQVTLIWEYIGNGRKAHHKNEAMTQLRTMNLSGGIAFIGYYCASI
jgi:hypothetical protein